MILPILDHPNIVKFNQTFQDPRKLYFVLELVPNGELEDLIQRESKCFTFDCCLERFKKEVVQHFAGEIINALEYLHCMGIAHRDLKPTNILLDENYHLKLVDFATVKISDPKALDLDLTKIQQLK